ncbi:MAG: hypothetical protein ACYCTH_14720 [Cellulomonas sp.]
MRTNRSTPWIVAAALASIAVLALSWLLAISPELAAADDSRSQAAQQQSQNAVLQTRIAKLADQFTHLDEYKATLATLREQIPEKVDLTAINRGLSTLAATSGVTIMSVAATTPVGFTPVQGTGQAASAPTTDSAGTAAAGGATGSSATPSTPAAASAVPKGFYAVPLSITLLGTYDQATAFLSSFQTGAGRIFLATGITATSQQGAGASGGRPAVAAGDLSLTVAGYAYVLLGSTATTAAPTTPSTTPPTLPAPSGQKNPFQSVS